MLPHCKPTNRMNNQTPICKHQVIFDIISNFYIDSDLSSSTLINKKYFELIFAVYERDLKNMENLIKNNIKEMKVMEDDIKMKKEKIQLLEDRLKLKDEIIAEKDQRINFLENELKISQPLHCEHITRNQLCLPVHTCRLCAPR